MWAQVDTGSGVADALSEQEVQVGGMELWEFGSGTYHEVYGYREEACEAGECGLCRISYGVERGA